MDLENTRLSLHAVAELLLAGPQYAESKTIKLRVTPGGFGTIALPEVRLAGTSLITADRMVALSDRTIAEVAQEAGLIPRSLSDVYSDHVAATGADVLKVGAADAAEIAEALRVGQEALLAFAPHQTPILWPEHFDLGIALGEVNYGVSAGDTYIGVPYAYVGPWNFPAPSGDDRDSIGDSFWNAPFGAALPLTAIPDLLEFFKQGQGLA